MWKMLVTTARSAHCQRCTSCSRQYCTEDYTQRSTRNKRKIRLASESPNQNVDSNDRLHEGFRLFSHNIIWKALKACDIKHDYISLLKKIYKDQKASVQTDEESNIFEIRKGNKQGDPLSSLLFNTVLQYSLEDDIQRWQKKKRSG